MQKLFLKLKAIFVATPPPETNFRAKILEGKRQRRAARRAAKAKK